MENKLKFLIISDKVRSNNEKYLQNSGVGELKRFLT